MSGHRRRETPTPRQCPHCIGREKAGCRLCGGAGIVSRDKALAYERERQERLTGQLEAFEVTVARLIEMLEARRVALTIVRASADALEVAELAAEGKGLLAEFEVARALEPGNKARSDTVIRVLSYQQKALAYLATRGGG